MNEHLWQIHVSMLKEYEGYPLRNGLLQRLKAQGKTSTSLGFGGELDTSAYDIDVLLKSLVGGIGETLRKIDRLTEYTSQEKQERQLFELNIEFLDAVRRSALDVAMNLHAAGADVNFLHPRSKMSALHYAAARNREITRFLVNTGECDFLQKDKQGRLPHNLAYTFLKDRGVGKLLLKKENQQAVKRGHENLLEYLSASEL